jgi:hypothetical protein
MEGREHVEMVSVGTVLLLLLLNADLPGRVWSMIIHNDFFPVFHHYATDSTESTVSTRPENPR